ncbi:MAG: toll/interleukin-1 receptor domain-containing protein [Mesorhizobium sp.]|nr:MAG: toll/interleukin-1 receptor domain-containing protein [Mesorhizobium sp.]
MTHAFISYVREDAKVVGYICEILRKNNVKYWQDIDDIDPGKRWKGTIRQAIEKGAFYVACFSTAWQAREVTYANEELTIAIDQLRLRPTDRAWFIPIKLDQCEIPDRDIGGGETLRSIQAIDLPKEGWRRGLEKLLRALGVENPDLELGEPLGSGLPPNGKLGYGRMVVERTIPPLPRIVGQIFSITNGWVARTEENHILAYMETQAPTAQLQAVNEQLGLHVFYAISADGFISTDPANPNEFFFKTHHEFPKGTRMWDIVGEQWMDLQFDMTSDLEFVAHGILGPKGFAGIFQSESVFTMPMGKLPVKMFGTFDISVDPTHNPDPKVGNRS